MRYEVEGFCRCLFLRVKAVFINCGDAAETRLEKS